MTSSSAQEAAATLEAFIRHNFNLDDDDPYFDRDINLWEQGYVDSMGAIEVIAFLEEEFGTSIPEHVLFSPDFTSINGMAKAIYLLTHESA
jgi:acyl carrier protein